jgi:hypothetical protein
MSALRSRPAALLVVAALLGSCTHWHPSTVSPAELIAEEQPSQVRLTLWSGEQVILRRPAATADSIVGEEAGTTVTSGASPRRRASAVSDTHHRSVPFSSVRDVEVGGTDIVAPILAAIPLSVLVVAILYTIGGCGGWC